ncbi:MAG: type I-G CRISPR-associated protein Cas8g1/Csx17, partial [Thermoplasmataceae archaeon]
MKTLLSGCRGEPLSSYLKSLAVLRLIGEQKDPNVKGIWIDGKLEIQSVLDRDGIINFFIDEYSPTPIISPWNGKSGFYEGDDTKGIDAIIDSNSQRFQLYRNTIMKVQKFKELPDPKTSICLILEVLSDEAKSRNGREESKLDKLINETEKSISSANILLEFDLHKNSISEAKELIKNLKGKDQIIKNLRLINTEYNRLIRTRNKTAIIRACRNYLDPSVVEWIDAAILIDSNGERKFPPILGSGGNEGRLEYSKVFMSNLDDLLLQQKDASITRSLLKNALFGEPTSGLVNRSTGKFDPGRAGGFNQGIGDEQKDFPVNPWDFILLMEGTILWSGSMGKRNSADSGTPRSPFTVSISPVGYSSSSQNEQRTYEIWTPLWKNPLGVPELKAFFRESRSDVGTRPARNGIEFVEAISLLSVDRGISEFIRYPILKRRGKSYIAIPSGHFHVRSIKEADLIKELNPILSRIDSFLRKFEQSPPAELVTLRSNLDRAIFDVLMHGGSTKMIKLLSAIGSLERAISRRDHNKDPMIVRPLTGLSLRWLKMADDGSVEFRLATALASIGSTDKIGPIRSSLERVDPEKPYLWSMGRGQFAWIGNTFASRLANVLHRRMMDGKRFRCQSNPIRARIGLNMADISQ